MVFLLGSSDTDYDEIRKDHYHGPEIYESLPEQVALIYLPILKSTPVERQTLVRVTILVEVDQSVI